MIRAGCCWPSRVFGASGALYMHILGGRGFGGWFATEGWDAGGVLAGQADAPRHGSQLAATIVAADPASSAENVRAAIMTARNACGW